MAVKAVQLLLNEQLPEDVRDYARTYDTKSINDMMTDIAEKHPDDYADIIKKIMDVGRDAVYYTGETVTLNDFKPVFDKKPILDQMDKEIAYVKHHIKNKKDRDNAITSIYEKYTSDLEKITMDAASKKENNLFNAVKSGARGNPTQLKAMLTTPGVYTDFKGRTIPMFIRKSYSEGLDLPSYLAGTYGTRNSTVTIKKGTATAGGWGKSVNRPLATMVVTSIKDNSDNGIDLDIDDDSLFGRVLARPAGGLPAGTLIDRYALESLKKNKVKKVIVHSPIATISENGISAEAVGMSPFRRLYFIGEHPGFNASTALTEPAIQGGLNSKHIAGAFKGKKSYSGLPYILQFTESPEEFKDRAAVSEVDGTVSKIYDAPQGGKYIIVDGKEHYVLPGMDLKVKIGDKVERGEILSDGLADPEDITRLRGIGEGRKYFTERFKQLLDDSGNKANKRNIELLARAFIDKVKVTDPDGLGDFLPGDIVSYNKIEANYTPEENSVAYSVNDTSDLVGKYLQKPVLHYTIGTKLTPSMIKRIKESGITDKLLVSPTPPKFEPVLIRLREAATKGERDWLSRATASYQKNTYLESASRGYKTNIKENYNPFARLSQPDFASNIYETGRY